jgi:hypothetical protein
MTTQQELCSTIESIYPQLGACGVDFDVEFSHEVKAWVVKYERGGHALRTYVEVGESDACVDENMCVPLGLQVGQLQANFEKYIHEHALEDE